MKIGTVTGREKQKNLDGEVNTLLLQLTISEDEDVQTAEFYGRAGEDYSPPDGALVAVLDVAPNWRIVVAVHDGQAPDVEPGERELYSLDEGVKKARFKLLKNGNLKLNEGEDYAVAFEDLKNGFDTLKNDFNKFVGVFNAHTQAVTGTTAAAPVTLAVSSSASVDASKVESVRVP